MLYENCKDVQYAKAGHHWPDAGWKVSQIKRASARETVAEQWNVSLESGPQSCQSKPGRGTWCRPRVALLLCVLNHIPGEECKTLRLTAHQLFQVSYINDKQSSGWWKRHLGWESPGENSLWVLGRKNNVDKYNWKLITRFAAMIFCKCSWQFNKNIRSSVFMHL